MEEKELNYWKRAVFKARLEALAVFDKDWQAAEKWDSIADQIQEVIEWQS